MTDKPLDIQIAEAYKDSQEAMQENFRLREQEDEIAIKRKEAHQRMLTADDKLWILRQKAASYKAKDHDKEDNLPLEPIKTRINVTNENA